MNFDELVARCKELPEVESALAKAVAAQPGLDGQETKARQQLAEKQTLRDKAAAALKVLKDQCQPYLDAEQKLRAAEAEVARLEDQSAALQAAITRVSQSIALIRPGGSLNAAQTQALIQDLLKLRSRLPTEAIPPVNPLIQKVMQGGRPTYEELVTLRTDWQKLAGQQAKKVETARKQEEAARAELARYLSLKPIADQVPAAEQKLKQADDELKRAKQESERCQKASADNRNLINSLQNRRNALREMTTTGLIASLDPYVPIALLPIRLETRYVERDAQQFLAIRVYPDDIHQDAHEPELTPDEVTWGAFYWTEAGESGADASKQLQAWSGLAARFGPTRAAWVARQTNPARGRTQSVDKDAWGRAVYTNVLPDRWIALCYRFNAAIGKYERIFTEWGAPIEQPLATGITPSRKTEVGEIDDGIDPAILWMVDFNAARNAGMGILVRIEPGMHFDRVLVLGVKATLHAPASATRLQTLLDAHHYTWGLSFVPQGTATNNAADDHAGYSRSDPGFETSFAVECGASLCAETWKTPPPDVRLLQEHDAERVAVALGLDSPAVFAHVAHAGGHEQQQAAAMNTVLWSATWEYFLTQMLRNEQVGRSNFWRQHFIDYVRGRGPLPAFRVGNQPYGLLPITSLDRWAKIEDDIPGLFESSEHVRLLARLRDHYWSKPGQPIPHVGSENPNKDKDALVMEILGMSAVSSNFFGRNLFGKYYHLKILEDLLDLRRKQPAEFAKVEHFWAALREHIARLVGLVANLEPGSMQTRLEEATFEAQSFPISGPLVQDTQTGEKLDQVQYYLQHLINTSPEELVDEMVEDLKAEQPRRRPLLYLLLRHATLLEYGRAAEVLTDSGPHLEAEIIDLPPPTRTITALRHLLTARDPGQGNQPIHKTLFDYHRKQPSDVGRRLNRFFESLGQLSKMLVPELELLLGETLDLSSHRLDAGITSVATRRLAELRELRPQGVYLGSYGWVENLGPSTTQSSGYIHTPSMVHAATAAVLRSGYLSHDATGDGALLQIDLSSARVRQALWLMDGVRQSQPLGALLGYRFERLLHEAGLDVYIARFRELAPLVANKLSKKDAEEYQPVETIAASNVVDGLALLRRWQEAHKQQPPQWSAKTIPFGEDKLPEATLKALPRNGEDFGRLRNIFLELEDTVDALSDISVSEGVYQAVQGNYLRAGASLDALARGEVPPVEPEVIRTPRSGVALTHRLLTLFSTPAANTVTTTPFLERWRPQSGAKIKLPSSVELRPRAYAEPLLNAWAAQLLGDPGIVTCQVRYIDTRSGEQLANTKEETISLKELGLCPLDVLYASAVTETAQQSDLERRIAYYALTSEGRPTHLPNTVDWRDVGVRISFDREEPVEPGKSPDTLTFPEFLEIARTACNLITSARTLRPEDLRQPGSNDPVAHISIQDLRDRVESIVSGFKNAVEVLNTALESCPPVKDVASQKAVVVPKTIDSLRTDLLALSDYGIPGAVPCTAVGEDADGGLGLLKQAKSILADAAARGERIDVAKVTLDKWIVRANSGEVEPPTEQDYVQYHPIPNPILDEWIARARGEIARPKNEVVEPPTEHDYVQYHLGRLHEVFGTSFKVLPRFSLPEANELLNDFAQSAGRRGATRPEVACWFERVAPVREGVARLRETMLYAEAVSAGDQLDLHVAQVPFVPPASERKAEEVPVPDRWVALKPLDGKSIPGGRVSLVAHTPLGLRNGEQLAGILIDDWVEVVPSSSETTALTFHYDAPGSCAPNAVLLAVAPDPGRAWDLDTLEAVLSETIDLVKLRLVDPDSLPGLGHMLPGLYFAFNADGDTVALRFPKPQEAS